jgi:hypothetical protein
MAALAPTAELADGYSVLSHLRRGRELDGYEVRSEERAAFASPRCSARTA